MKRTFDFLLASCGLVLVSPFLGLMALAVWVQDFRNPLYFAPRAGKGRREIHVVKLRSMTVGADKTGVASTSQTDARITPVGHLIRKFKFDELTQLWNVVRGDMSLVGPRPNLVRETEFYTEEELRMLTVVPGITDFASIVFSDEGEILKVSEDPDLDYDRLIRPWKHRLALFYVDHRSLWVDFTLVMLTAVAIFFRRPALRGVAWLLAVLGAGEALVRISRREEPLVPTPPPGMDKVVSARPKLN